MSPLPGFGPRKHGASRIGPVTSQWVTAIAAFAAIVIAALLSVLWHVDYWLALVLLAPVTYAITYWMFLRRDGGTRL